MFLGYLPDIASKFKKNEVLGRVFGYLFDVLDENSEAHKRITSLKPQEEFIVHFDGGARAIEQAYYTKTPQEAFYESHSEMVDLLGGDNNAACHLESQKLLARYNGDMEPDPDGGFLVVITWEDIEGLTNYDITVTWREDPIYELETSVFYE